MTTFRKSLDELPISDERLAELAAMPEDSIDTRDIPELDEAFWQRASVRFPGERLTVQFDHDVVAWFRSQGRDYQSRMNAVLRAYYEAHR